MQPVITLWRAGDVPRLWLDQIAAWFLHEFHWPMAHTAPADWRVLATIGGDLIGHLSITERAATAGGAPVALAGIGAVIVQPGWRGRGVGRALLARAEAAMREETAADFGLLICEAHRLTFYTALGWQPVPGPLFFTSWRGERQQAGQHVLVLPLREGLTWPPGEIDLCGLPW